MENTFRDTAGQDRWEKGGKDAGIKGLVKNINKLDFHDVLN